MMVVYISFLDFRSIRDKLEKNYFEFDLSNRF